MSAAAQSNAGPKAQFLEVRFPGTRGQCVGGRLSRNVALWSHRGCLPIGVTDGATEGILPYHRGVGRVEPVVAGMGVRGGGEYRRSSSSTPRDEGLASSRRTTIPPSNATARMWKERACITIIAVPLRDFLQARHLAQGFFRTAQLSPAPAGPTEWQASQPAQPDRPNLGRPECVRSEKARQGPLKAPSFPCRARLRVEIARSFTRGRCGFPLRERKQSQRRRLSGPGNIRRPQQVSNRC